MVLAWPSLPALLDRLGVPRYGRTETIAEARLDSPTVCDLDLLDRTPLSRYPFDFIVVPGFLRAGSLEAVLRDLRFHRAAGRNPPEPNPPKPTPLGPENFRSSGLRRRRVKPRPSSDLTAATDGQPFQSPSMPHK